MPSSPLMPRARRRDTRAAIRLLAILLLSALALRSFVFAPFSIPSPSMMPGLLPGDVVLVAKWPYGLSRYSLPGDPDAPGFRVLAASPARGDIVVFRAHTGPKRDFVKRVLGKAGDVVELRRGELLLNGRPIPQTRIADFLSAAEWPCPGPTFERACRYERLRETLDDGRSYPVLDLEQASALDDFGPMRVPDGALFLLGDHRDRSADSRLPAEAGGIGLVAEDRLLGRPVMVVFSSTGTARWSDPASWLGTVRWDRIGRSL